MRTYSLAGMVALALSVAAAPAAAATVNISAGPTGWGCTTCYGGPGIFGSGPGAVVTLTNEGVPGPLQLSLAAGTYAVTNAAPTGDYSAWRYNGGDNWAWNFVIGVDNGNNTATVIEVGSVGGSFSSQVAAATTPAGTYSFQTLLNPVGSAADFYHTFTLTAPAVLDFFVVDGYLPDNIGGVSLNIDPVATVPEPAQWATMALGLALAASVSSRRRRRTSIPA